MAKENAPRPLEHYSKLNSSTWYHQPASTLTLSPRDPNFILILGWMDASARNLSKYTANYELLYPSAHIVAITTSAINATLWSEATNVKRVKPVVEILCALPENTTLLVHLFSNGGAFTARVIARAYKEKMGKALPTSAMILDSSPGKATYEATVRAFAVSLPKNIVVRSLGKLLLRFLWCLYILGYMLRRRVELVEQTRRDLNDESLFDITAPRIYIYSVADNMVAWDLVEEHAEDAKKLGYKVTLEKYLKSGHCAHLLIDSERYGKAIQCLWDTALNVVSK